MARKWIYPEMRKWKTPAVAYPRRRKEACDNVFYLLTLYADEQKWFRLRWIRYVLPLHLDNVAFSSSFVRRNGSSRMFDFEKLLYFRKKGSEIFVASVVMALSGHIIREIRMESFIKMLVPFGALSAIGKKGYKLTMETFFRCPKLPHELLRLFTRKICSRVKIYFLWDWNLWRNFSSNELGA